MRGYIEFIKRIEAGTTTAEDERTIRLLLADRNAWNRLYEASEGKRRDAVGWAAAWKRAAEKWRRQAKKSREQLKEKRCETCGTSHRFLWDGAWTCDLGDICAPNGFSYWEPKEKLAQG